MRCFVQATDAFIRDKALAEKYVRDTIFKGQITQADFRDAIGNAPYTYDITSEHVQVTTDLMAKTGVGRLARPPVAKEWVRTDLLAAAKQGMNIQ
jgi:NitT/TauT family transport system substrate-binding protein